MLKVYEEVSLVDHIINLYGPNIIIGSAGIEQQVGVSNLGFDSEERDLEAPSPPPPPATFENVNIKKAFNQSIIQQKKLSCIYDQDKVTRAVYSFKKSGFSPLTNKKKYTLVYLGAGRDLCPEKGKSPADEGPTCQ